MPQPDSKPRLAPHVRRQADRVTGGVMLLHPEGAVELSETADAIVEFCDGARTTEEIVSALAAEFEVAPEMLRADVESCIHSLIERGLLVA
ncbi:MAG: pyrroloquinoline quinone biosynthesis peptide chaperone PqqD [Chthoniobacterales bacterium]